MKKDFKTRIAEVAAKIAEIDGPNKVTADASRVNGIIDSISRLEAPFKAIDSAVEAKDIVLHIMSMMSKLSDGGKRTALNQALTTMAKAAASSKADTPDVSSSDQAKLGLPELKEAFDRINKK